MVKVKICGLTRVEDALFALHAGADYLGFILYPPSPRAVNPDQAAMLVREIRRKLAAVTEPSTQPSLVGVFVNQEAGDTADLLDYCGLDLAQLSGDEPANQIVDPASPLFGRAYKALRPRNLATADELIHRYTNFRNQSPERYPRVLMDTPHGTLYGGTGQPGDWHLAADVAARTPGLMLAGGLTPDNVAEAIRAVRPFAVDVAGGVESQPGIKDLARVEMFIHNVKVA
ncbi:MAG: phosphoribosylanthranilate isomerase [Anaerolineales bacterium]|uniref:phosphoribosylanthranilate isomerase n=1 Tax=Promineifilum sp. TaxID=2664178 RepID=UPI001D432C18|nr:phosphoribosylanthranilate isomerase [Anaerolineales bacterium]MCB8935027.1 phosphoribosylanthranilate isomerase [Promineifilum sp.]MCO5181813.1 phosphoribosylanthranilate isomerase [Promineifilum sp.]